MVVDERSGDRYALSDGTSFATPTVTNVAAKMMALCPSLDARETKRLLMETAAPQVALQRKVAGWGVLNPLRAYRAAALVACIEKGETLERAISRLPGPMTPKERERLSKIVGRHLADRAAARGAVPILP